MTFIVALFMLLTPGLIALRILHGDKAIGRGDWKFIVCDYFLYSFLIQIAVYGFMFFTYPPRTVSFHADILAASHILHASFVFKYSVIALVSALVLPFLVPKVVRFWQRQEEKRLERLEGEKEKSGGE